MPEPPPRRAVSLSVVVPCRNVAGTLGDQLDALLAQQWSHEWEVIVVDNQSSDNTRAVAESYGRDPRLRLVSASDRAGLGYTRNVGIQAAQADRIAICDGDDIVGDGWVAAIGDALATAGCVTGPLKLDRLNPPWLAESRGRRVEHEIRRFHGIFPVAAGGNLGVQRAIIERVGPFREDFDGAEDAEFSLRLWRHGIPVTFDPAVSIQYRYRRTARELWAQGRHYGLRQPELCRAMRHNGMKPPSRVSGWRSWAWLLLNVPKLRTPEGRAVLAWVAGSRAGHVEGSLRARSLYL